jgi:hypothetical protein
LVLSGYALDHRDLNFSDLDTNHDGILGNGDAAVSYTPDGDIVLGMSAYGGAGSHDSVTLKGVARLHSTDVTVT